MTNFDQYKKLFKSIKDSVVLFDNKLNILYYNDIFKKLFNIDKAKPDKLKDIFDKKLLNKIKKNSCLFNNTSNIYEINFDDKHFSFRSTLFEISKNNSFDFTLIENITELRTNQLLNDCVYKISEASHYVDELNDLYPIIHKILSEVVYTKNFYIAVADWDHNIIHFPYFVDHFDKKPESQEIGNGLTEYVLKNGQSILVNPEQFTSLNKNKKINVQGTTCIDWLGVPLRTNMNITIGALVIQSYSKNHRFSEKDEKILTFVSDQIAMAIQRKKDSVEIKKKAYYDQLTGLTNKVLFNDRLDQSIHYAKRHNSIVGVLFLDLDNFKYVNDSMGHTCGDSLLKIVSKRIKDCLRKTDTVSRWGGDEFTIILHKIKDIKDISTLASRILNNELKNIIINKQELRITASIGIALYPQDGKDIETLIKNADAAMYKAKDKGKNQFQFFKPKMNEEILERVSNENNLYKAIEKEEFLLLFQPQIDLQTNKIIGFESLIRWDTPDKGVLAPYKFIPIAEETNLIVPLGEWIIQETCKQNKKWHDTGHKLISAVNISAKQFVRSDLTSIIKNILAKTKLDPQYLELELTETILMEDIDKTVEILKELKSMGVKVSIDDFGTGYSSLSYLKLFPIDTLKIDQSFISTIKNDKDNTQNATIANIVIDLGHKLGMKVIAEGVETEDQIKFLKKYACDKIQGYVISEPVNEIEFNLLLAKHS